MTIRWLDDLDSALRAGGLDYIEVGATAYDPTHATSWRDRGRPASTGNFDPVGVLNHHTADPGATVGSNLAVILKGNAEAPGPISHLYISREPRLYLVAAGRCNHAGRGSLGPGAPCQDLNARLMGIEVSNDGVGERWSDAQVELYAATDAALCKWYGWDENDIWLHWTTGPQCGNFKIDPAGAWLRQPDLPGYGPTRVSRSWRLDLWRGFVAEHIGGTPTPPQPQPIPPTPTPVPPAPTGDDMPTPIGFIICNAGTRGHHIDGSEYEVKNNGTVFYVTPAGMIQWMHDWNEFVTKRDTILPAAGLRRDTWNDGNAPVGDPDAFGMLVGDVPGRP